VARASSSWSSGGAAAGLEDADLAARLQLPAATKSFVTCAAQLTYAPWFRAGQHLRARGGERFRDAGAVAAAP
jgi:hypothetical protein